MVWNSTTITFSEIAAENSKENGGTYTNNYEENASCDSSSEIGKEEDSDSGVHQDCQHDSGDASCHVATSCR